jgi:PadR family transcriptional regulator, regulatory protein AphA
MLGYEIRQWIEEYLGFFWSEGWGQVHPALRELESQGLVRLEEAGPAAETKRARKVYSITESGRAYLTRYLGIPPEDQGFRNELLLKVFFWLGDK